MPEKFSSIKIVIIIVIFNNNIIVVIAIVIIDNRRLEGRLPLGDLDADTLGKPGADGGS